MCLVVMCLDLVCVGGGGGEDFSLLSVISLAGVLYTCFSMYSSCVNSCLVSQGQP